ncbi:MAG: radical SAM protein [Ruminococcus flavefaciens]|nr:radical SAM protein [Ruminococcus flavefaciens]
MKIYEIDENVSAMYLPDSQGLLYYRRDIENDIMDVIKNCNENSMTCPQLLHELEANNFFSLQKISTERPIRTLYFCTSYNCNLACSYCLTNGSVSCGRSKIKLSNEDIEKSIEHFVMLSTPGTEREVVIYGGEPTLYPDMIKTIYNMVRKYEEKSEITLKPARFILCTNGILIDNDLALFIKKSGIYPAISFDGFPELHNQYRKTINGQGSFDLTEKGYKILQKHNIDAGITLALGSHTIKKLPQIVKYLNDKFHPKTIAANSMLDFENSSNDWLPDCNEMPKILWNTFLTCRKEGIYLVKNIMDNRIKPFVECEPRIWGCTGTGARMGVLPDGNIVPCMALSHKFFKSIDNHPDIIDFCPTELRTSSPYLREECANCEAKATCGGGCPAAAILRNEHSANYLEPAHCNTSRYFLKKMIELLWSEINNKGAIKSAGYYLPTKSDRRKLYGRIEVKTSTIDFQYIPNQNEVKV